MQVKKFEAPTIQEALDTVKRELGPEAIILQTKRHRRGFGLLSRGSVEITAAVSDRSMQRKNHAERRLPEETREAVKKLPADRQAQVYEGSEGRGTAPTYARGARRPAAYAPSAGGAGGEDDPIARLLAGTGQDRVQLTPPARRPIPAPSPAPATPSPEARAATAAASSRPRRYIDIDDDAGSSSSPASTSAALEAEVRSLKLMIQELRIQARVGDGGASDAGPADWSAAARDAYELMVLNGVERRLAHRLVKSAAFELDAGSREDPDAVLDRVAGEILKIVRTVPLASLTASTPGGGPGVFAFVGPTGAGKTTCVAKLAARLGQAGAKKVGVIRLAPGGGLTAAATGEFDPLAILARNLGLPYRDVRGIEDLAAALADFRPLDTVLVDAGVGSSRDAGAIEELRAKLATVPGVVTVLVAPAASRDQELVDATRRFRALAPRAWILTKLDETVSHGHVLNAVARADLPLSHFTMGPRVPDDIEDATAERLASLVLDLD